MEPSQIVSLVSVVVALTAVTSSSLLNAQSVRLNRNAQHTNITINMLAAQRSGEFFTKEKRLWDELPTCDPNLGFMNLPEPIRSDLIDIGLYYHALGYLSEYGYANRDFLIVQTQYRLLRTWDTIQPFVEGERRLRGASNLFLNAYEIFAKDAREIDTDKAMQKLQKGGRRRRRLL